MIRDKDWGVESLLFLIILGLGLAHALHYRFYTIDDAAISFRFAEHFAQGLGLRFNLGQTPSEGFTNFLWTILQVPSFWFHWDPMQVSKLWGCLAMILGQVCLWRLGRLCFCTRFLALIPPALVASHPGFAVWTIAGLETSLFAALLTGACLASFLADRERSHRYFLLSAIAFACLCLLRPEGLMFAGVMGLNWIWWIRSNGWQRGLNHWFAIVGGTVVVFHLGRYLYFGSLLPNTLLVKGPSDSYTLTFALQQFQLLLDRLAHRVAAIAALLGLILAVCARWLPLPRKKWRAEQGLALYLLVTLTLYALYLSRLAWDLEVGIGRYAMHVLPLLYFSTIWGIDLLLNIRVSSTWSRWGRIERWTKITALFALLIGFGVQAWQNYQWGLQHFSGHNGVAYSIEKVHRPIAEYFLEHAQAGDKVITQDMGFIPFLAKKVTFIDTIGICDRTIAQELYQGKYNYYSAYLSYADPERVRLMEATNARIRDYLRAQNARWILAFADVADAEAEAAELSLKALESKTYDGFFDRYVQLNPYYHGFLSEPDVMAKYRPVAAWAWSTRAYYVLYEASF